MSERPDRAKARKFTNRLDKLEKPQGRTSSKQIDRVLGELNFSQSTQVVGTRKKTGVDKIE